MPTVAGVDPRTFAHLWADAETILDRDVTEAFHMRQTATLLELGGYGPQMVFAGLVHDLFKPVAMIRHGEVAAIAFDHLDTAARAFLAGHSEWVEAVRGDEGAFLPYRQRTLGQLDADSFDPDGPCHDLDHFAPLIARWLCPR